LPNPPPIADILPTMASEPNSRIELPSPTDPNRRGLLVIVGLLIVVLVVGGAIVAKSFLTVPIPGRANGAISAIPRDGAAAIEVGLEAAATYQRERKFPEAVAILTKLSEQSPTDRAVRIAFAQALIGQEKYADAYKQYEAAISLSEGGGKPIRKPTDPDPGAAPVGMKRDTVLAELQFEAGTCANMAGLADRAEEHYWMAQMLNAAEGKYPLCLAMMQIRKNDGAAAGASLLRAVKINPDLAEAWGTMAELELKKNQLSLAAQHIQVARKLQPEVSRWRIVQARVLNRQGDAEQAAAILQALPSSQRADRAILELQAESYGLMQKPRMAAEMYEQAGNLVPTDAEIAYAAALWYQRAGDTAKATQLAQKAAMLGHDGGKELLNSLQGK
jgi:tetratricopeptide (TPR) repeat protein